MNNSQALVFAFKNLVKSFVSLAKAGVVLYLFFSAARGDSVSGGIMSKVMVIDDEKDVVYLLKVLMEREQFEVTEAFNGLEAYNKLTSPAVDKVIPDVIILDIMMPEMDGYTFQSKLQEIDGLSGIPIIILTAKGQMKDLFENSNNIFAFVEKPFEPRDLVKKVKDAIASKK